MSEEILNPMDELFTMTQNNQQEISKELFQLKDEKDVDLKTDVIYPEDVFISTLKFNDLMLKNSGLKPLLDDYILDLLRIRFSMDRKSRSEFVDTNTKVGSGLNFPDGLDSIKDSRK